MYIQARRANKRGNLYGAQSKAWIALFLNIVTIMSGVMIIITMWISAAAVLPYAVTTADIGGYYYNYYCHYSTRYRSASYTYYSYNDYPDYKYYIATYSYYTCNK